MADVSTLEYKTEAREPIKVKDISKVPLKRGQLFLNAGQTETLRAEYPHLFDVGVVTVYSVAGQSENEDTRFDSEEMCLVNLNKMADGLLPYSESFMNVFMPAVSEQLRTDLYSAQAAKLLVEMGGADNLKYVRAKRTFVHNAKTTAHFLEKLGGVDEFDSVERFRPEINKTIATGEEQFGKKPKFGRGLKGWLFDRKDYAQNVFTEDEKRMKKYLLRLNKKIEKNDLIISTENTTIKASTFSVTNATAPENFDWESGYDISSQGTHTIGRRGEIDDFVNNGIDPVDDPIVCGYVAEPDQSFQDTETIKSNYGHIFEPESAGFIVVLGPEVTETDGYEANGVEARVKQKVTPQMAKAIVVGNKKMEAIANEAISKTGLSIPVILLTKTENRNSDIMV